jgi:hypothetical protein
MSYIDACGNWRRERRHSPRCRGSAPACTLKLWEIAAPTWRTIYRWLYFSVEATKTSISKSRHSLEAVPIMTNSLHHFQRHLLGKPAKPVAPHLTDHPTVDIGRADQLEYLADLILELKEIADNLGCATLAGLLVVGHREAKIQAHER